MLLNQVKCYERFNLKKKLYQHAHLSIVQFLTLLIISNSLIILLILFNGPFIIPLVRFFCWLYKIRV